MVDGDQSSEASAGPSFTDTAMATLEAQANSAQADVAVVPHKVVKIDHKAGRSLCKSSRTRLSDSGNGRRKKFGKRRP